MGMGVATAWPTKTATIATEKSLKNISSRVKWTGTEGCIGVGSVQPKKCEILRSSAGWNLRTKCVR